MDQPFAGFDANGTLGATTIGIILSSILYGVAVVQTYTYYVNFVDDHWWLKSLVAIVMLSDTAHMACIVHALYTLNITHYGDPSAVLLPPNTFFVAAVFSSFIALCVQGFFAYRIKRFSKRWTMAVICLLLVILRLIFSIIVTIKGFEMTSMIEFVRDSKSALTVMLTVSVGCDAFIAGSMCFYLGRQRNKFNKHTTKTIDKIIAWTLETGFANSIAGIVMLVFFIQFPNKFLWVSAFVLVSRIFANSLLASLNARTILRSGKFDGLQATSSTFSRANARSGVAMHVEMTTQKETARDGDFDYIAQSDHKILP
ncbi:hypothetical protein CVT24_012298 [Panaeolus cyanescens]|uniref:DUF6534 domain-containing protein n=1 Tax=Panaeolus cyanescens TaxID=181874 RepID=A0A409W4D4_9AGAR|nr:hypothetical protein CVT24_012298 [Panaeolus cyanescens]